MSHADRLQQITAVQRVYADARLKVYEAYKDAIIETQSIREQSRGSTVESIAEAVYEANAAYDKSMRVAEEAYQLAVSQITGTV